MVCTSLFRSTEWGAIATPLVVFSASLYQGLRRGVVWEVDAFRLQGVPGLLPDQLDLHTMNGLKHQLERVLVRKENLQGSIESFLLIYSFRWDEGIRFIVY